jgi:hypothetical protein
VTHRNRQQLTLFVSGAASAVIEPIRQTLDPVQYRLIPAHVTLCREDELTAHDTSFEVLTTFSRYAPLILQFGPPELFDGHGVRLPCIAGESHFHELRAAILGAHNIRMPHAHLTLAHPRNPRAPGNTPSAYASLVEPLTITLSRLALIEQVEQNPWRVRQDTVLAGSS